MTNNSMKLMKKITPSTVCGGAVNPDMPAPIKEPRALYDLYGIAVKTRTGHTDKGDWLQFIGDFEAICPSGEVFRASRCHIPQPFEEMLYTQLMQIQSKDAKASVQFAVRVSIVPPVKGKPSAVGYEYRIEPLIDSRDSNPLTSLRQQVHESARLLGAQKK